MVKANKSEYEKLTWRSYPKTSRMADLCEVKLKHVFLTRFVPKTLTRDMQ